MDLDAAGRPDRQANERDVEEYRRIIKKLQDKRLLEYVPQFSAITADLLDMTLGIVGLLKEFMTQCLVLQIENSGKWNHDFVRRAMKKPYVLRKIRTEVQNGEAAMRKEGFFDETAPTFAYALQVAREAA